jgi:hypothetical protein
MESNSEMTWNHRVIRHSDEHGGGTDVWFGIHECFYFHPGDEIPDSWTEDAISVIGGTFEELGETLMRMGRCLEKPILEIDGNALKIWKGGQNGTE